ncbi:Thioesterase/thiol ester dehydrase-isomerase [Nemania sp. NC0429]|nr:Thioesterase/thiol ester dehydrase-isomerase [Nemania sp. NC0429]
MACRTARIEPHVAVIPAPELGPDVYTNANPLTLHDGPRPVFGGFLISQALSATCATVPRTFQPYSSQSSFLAPARGGEKITYRVQRTWEGRNFMTRIVHATQGVDCVYVAVISFQSAAYFTGVSTLEYGTPKPELDQLPDDISPDAIQALQSSMVDRSASVMQQSAEDRPLDWRPYSIEMSDDPTQLRVRGYVRSPTPLSTSDSSTHLAAFAYASDEFFFGPALAANPAAVGKGFRNVTVGASLTHNVSFHDRNAKIDQWVVLERETTWGSAGRVMVQQKFWNLEGKMILSGSQEALIRLKGANI